MKQSQLTKFFKTPASVLNPVKMVLYGQPQPLQQCPTQTRPSVKRDQSVYDATKRTRVFQDTWLVSNSWLRYDKDNNVMYCEVCREFSHLHPASGITMIKGDCSFRKTTLDSHGGSLGHARCMNAYKAKHCPQETPMAKIHRN